jgi:hypothetical protein
VQKELLDCGISIEDLEELSPRFFQKDGINIDRIDYMIRDLKAVGRIFQPEYSMILNNLVIEDKRIKCRDMGTAKLLFDKFLEVNQEVYFDPKVEAASVAFTALVQKMLLEGFLKEDHFEKSEEELLDAIKNSPYKAEFEAIGPNSLKGSSLVKNGRPPILRKLRFIDPEIQGFKGTLTDHDPNAKARLEEYLLKTPKEVYYHG